MLEYKTMQVPLTKKSIELPKFIVINVNDECFFRCQMCFKWKPHIHYDDNTKYITSKDLMYFIKDLSTIVKKPTKINFAGGEPFLRKDLLEIIKYSSELGFYTTVATNSWLINSEKKAKEIIESGLNEIIFSIDGATAKTHDKMRGMPGSFKKAVNAINYLTKHNNKNNLKIAIQTVLCELNYHEAIDMIDWVDNTSYIESIHFNAVTEPNNTHHNPNWYKEDFSHLWPKDILKFLRVLNQIYYKKKDGSKIAEPIEQIRGYKRYFTNPKFFVKDHVCHFDKSLSLTPTGDIYMCNHYKSLGNITRVRLKDAWNSEIANTVRKQIKSCRKNCHEIINCYFKE